MNARENLTCCYCNEIYVDPITLPCGDNLCKQHIDELISNNSTNKFFCPICNEESTNQSFKVNKLIQNFIKNNLHKFELDSKFKIIYENLKAEIENLDNILKDPENLIYEEIAELKRQVDLDRERSKSEIDSLADGFIQQLESYETRFKAEYKTNIHLENYNALVQSSRKQLNEYEQCLNFFSTTNEERNEKSLQIEKITADLQPKITQLKQNLFSNLSITYNPIPSNTKDLFGKLIVKNKKEFLGKEKLSIHAQAGALLVLKNGDLVSDSSVNAIKIWDTNTGALKQTLTGHTDLIRAFIDIDDNSLISASEDGTIKIWNISEGTVKTTLTGHNRTVLAIILTRDGYLASGSGDGSIKIWDIDAGILKRTLTGHTCDVWALVLLNNGDLASASEDFTIKIWDADNGTVKMTLTGHFSQVYRLALLENGDLVSGSNDETIKIWNVEDGTVKTTLTGHTDYIFALRLLDNGFLASGSEDCTIKIWNIEDGTLFKSITEKGPVYCLAKLQNGCLVSGCMDGTIKIWE